MTQFLPLVVLAALAYVFVRYWAAKQREAELASPRKTQCLQLKLAPGITDANERAMKAHGKLAQRLGDSPFCFTYRVAYANPEDTTPTLSALVHVEPHAAAFAEQILGDYFPGGHLAIFEVPEDQDPLAALRSRFAPAA